MNIKWRRSYAVCLSWFQYSCFHFSIKALKVTEGVIFSAHSAISLEWIKVATFKLYPCPSSFRTFIRYQFTDSGYRVVPEVKGILRVLLIVQCYWQRNRFFDHSWLGGCASHVCWTDVLCFWSHRTKGAKCVFTIVNEVFSPYLDNSATILWPIHRIDPIDSCWRVEGVDFWVWGLEEVATQG